MRSGNVPSAIAAAWSSHSGSNPSAMPHTRSAVVVTPAARATAPMRSMAARPVPGPKIDAATGRLARAVASVSTNQPFSRPSG